MSTTPRAALALAALLCGTACSSETTPAGDVDAATVGTTDAGIPASDAGGDGGAPAPDAAMAEDAAASDASVPAERLEGLVGEVTTALCGALARCCDDASRARFFAPMRASERVPMEVRMRIPEDGSVSDEACPALLADVYETTPIGPWAREALAGRVAFVASEADACLATLASAACGAPLADALFDGTCFGFSAPGGGAEQRRAFARASEDGDVCMGIADGVGASFFGSCDPSESFCCLMREDRCVPAIDAPGVCVPASQVGEACGFVPLRLCATGLECNDADRCEAPATATLAVGDRCAEGFTFLGDCEAGYCDFGGTDLCVAFRELGATCTYGYECASGYCAGGTCAADTFCAAP